MLLLAAALAVGVGGCGGDDASFLPPPDDTVLVAPEALSIVAEDTQNTLLWSAVPGAVGYNLYWSHSSGVTRQSGNAVLLVSSPYVHTGLTNGVRYYYVVTAVHPAGESRESPEVGGTPHRPAPGSPQGVTAIVTPEEPNSITVQWNEVTGATSYNLYWNSTGGVTTLDTLVADVTSPFIHTGLLGQTDYYYRVTAVGSGGESALSAEVSAAPRGSPGGGGGGGGGHDETFGNNLSVPVVFADGYGITGSPLTGILPAYLDVATGLRPLTTDSFVTFPSWVAGTEYLLGSVLYYKQQTASTWQADWVNGVGVDQNVAVDWGDNLSSQRFTSNSVIRIETTLYQTYLGTGTTAYTTAMSEYTMALLYGTRETEMQGTDTTILVAPRRHVFAVAARLRLEKLLGPGGAVDPAVTPTSIAVAESFGVDGPGGYGAEINVGGKLVYGYVWRLRQSSLPDPDKVGWWKATFALDPTPQIGTTTLTNRTYLQELDASDAGSATLDTAQNSTSIEFEVQSR